MSSSLVPAFRSAGVRWAALGIAATVLAADQLGKSLVLAAHPGTGTGAISVRLVRCSRPPAAEDAGRTRPRMCHSRRFRAQRQMNTPIRLEVRKLPRAWITSSTRPVTSSSTASKSSGSPMWVAMGSRMLLT